MRRIFLRNSQVLRNRGYHTRAFFTEYTVVASCDVEQAVLAVTGPRDRVEVDLLMISSDHRDTA
jgi:hypothetical protein